MYDSHSILEDVLIKNFCPKVYHSCPELVLTGKIFSNNSENKFRKYNPNTTYNHFSIKLKRNGPKGFGQKSPITGNDS